MANYRHILLATDFSKQSEVAALRAAGLAKHYGARLSVLHVVDYVPPGYVRVDLPDASETRFAERAEKKLADWTKGLGLKVANQWIEVGSTKREIVRIGKDNDVDLIVVGSHGEGGLALLVGSTTSGLLNEAACDVLSVRAKP